MHCALHFYMQKTVQFQLRFYIQKATNLQGLNGGLDGAIFYAKHVEEPFDDCFNVTFLIFEGLILKITGVCCIDNKFLIVFVGSMHIKLFCIDETNRQKYLK